MVFQELTAMQVAYELLSPLDSNAQQRVLAWLSAALADPNGAATAPDESAAPARSIAEVPVETAREDSVAEVGAERATAVPQLETAAPTLPDVDAATVTEPDVAVEPAPGLRPQRNRSADATGRRAAKAARSAPAATPADGTQSRQNGRPSGEQFLADLADAGSFKALAEKYGKSIGTISNWANQLREQGFDIPVGRRQKA